jgi:hypothetical protein
MNYTSRIRQLEREHSDCVERLDVLTRNKATNHPFIVECNNKKSRIEQELRQLRRLEYDDRNRVDLSDDR